MDGPRAEPTGNRFDELRAEAAEVLSYSANTLRLVRDRYRQAYRDELVRLEALRDALAGYERAAESDDASDGPTPDAGAAAVSGAVESADAAADTLEAGAPGVQLRVIRGQVDHSREDLGVHETELSRLELALRNVESTWLFLERGDASLVTDDSPVTGTAMQMRIVEAKEAERARLAQEVHDGPAQALANAIFQVEFVERIIDSDAAMARSELGFLGELLRRELSEVRTFVSQLRPPVLADLGLTGSIMDTVATQAALSGLQIETDLAAPPDRLTEAAQTVVLRVAQEALQNVRKHAGATDVVVATVLDNGTWVLEVRDHGRGFDVGAAAARGRRNFGLQFMRERAELIGAQFEVRSRPEAGTVVRLVIPLTRKESE